MIILLSGKHGSGRKTLAKELKSYWKLRSITTWSTRLDKVIKEFHDMMYVVAHRYRHFPKLEKGEVDQKLRFLIYEQWIAEFGGDVLVNTCKDYIEEVVKDWKKKDLLFNTIIEDVVYKHQFDAFPAALTIRLECSAAVRQKRSPDWDNHVRYEPHGQGLASYAHQGKFDIIVDTHKYSIEETRDIVVHYYKERMERTFVRES